MFALSFFGGLRNQYYAFKQATEFAPIKVSAQTARLFGDLARSVKSFEKTEYPKSLWLACLRSVQSVAIPLVYLSFASAVVMLLLVIVSKLLINGSFSFTITAALCAALLALGIFKNTLAYFSDTTRFEVMRMLQVYLMTLVNRKLLAVEPRTALSTGNLKTLVGSDVEAIEDFISAALANFTHALLVFLVLAPYVWISLGDIGLIGLFVVVLQLPMALGFAWWVEKFQVKAQAQQDALTTLIGEWVQNVRLVRYLGWQPKLNQEIARTVRRYTVVSVIKHFVVILTYGIGTAWWFIAVLVMLGAAKYLSLEMPSGDFFSSIWAMNYLSNQMMHAQWPFIMYGAAVAGKKRLEELFAKPELIRHLKRGGLTLQNDDRPRKVHLSQVSVKFEEREAVNNLTLSIDLLSRTAIVGDVGAGKTLLLELIVGELAPSRGKVMVEFESGLVADLWCEEVYYHARSFFAFSPQRPYLSNASLRDNIDLSGARSMDVVKECARLAHLEEDLKLFPRRLDEEVGETGINLSGGQKQRVSMARVFASGRPIFVLDDPLSAVDRKTEALLMNSIIEIAKGLVLVSHRLDELSVCSRVLVMRNGEMIEDGTPAALIANSQSEFSKFVDAHKTDNEEEK